MAYFATGRSTFPLRPGHEWAGAVVAVGDGVDEAWVGRRVTGDTMLASGRCDRCTSGRRHVCRHLAEVGISLGVDGALAERLVVPADSLHGLPEAVDAVAGALVEPGATPGARRARHSPARASGSSSGGPGRSGCSRSPSRPPSGRRGPRRLAPPERSDLPQRLGATDVWRPTELPDLPFHAIIDATDDATVPAAAVERVEPGGRVVGIGLAGGSEPGRHARARPARCDLRGDPQRLTGPRPGDRGLRERRGGSSTARRGDGRSRRSAGRAGPPGSAGREARRSTSTRVARTRGPLPARRRPARCPRRRSRRGPRSGRVAADRRADPLRLERRPHAFGSASGTHTSDEPCGSTPSASAKSSGQGHGLGERPSGATQ